MFVDFGMAVQYDGVCYLRFDDTNPEAEKQEYIDHIEVGRGGGCTFGGGRGEGGNQSIRWGVGWCGVRRGNGASTT